MICIAFATLLLGISFCYFIRLRSFFPEQWLYLINGRHMLKERAEKHNGTPFCLRIPGNRLHVLTSRKHWNELNNINLNELSTHAWSKQNFQPKFTFHFEWPDQRDEDGMPVVRAIRTITNQFPMMKGMFINIIREELNHTLKSNVRSDGTSTISLWGTVKHFTSRINMLIMLGEDVANNSVFVDRGLKYIDEVYAIAEVSKHLPSFIVPLVARLIKGRDRNRKYALEIISGQIEKYRKNDTSVSAKADTNTGEKPHSILEALVRSTLEDWQVRRDMNITFVTTTTVTPIVVTQLLQDIFTHPEYIPALREEVKGVLDDPSPNMTKLPLLEGFLTESMRTHCFLSTAVHRVSLKSLRFSGGYTVPRGEIVEFYQYGVMNDNSIYPNAEKFNPLRFKGTGRTATDVGAEWPFWGNSKLACPARFHVSNVVKLIAIYFIMNYDCEFEGNSSLNFEFREACIPRSSPKLVMKNRGT